MRRLKLNRTSARRSTAGTTLVEAMISLGIVSMLFGTLGVALIMGTQMMVRSDAQYDSAAAVSLSLERVLRDMEDAAVVTNAEYASFAYRKPLEDADGVYVTNPDIQRPISQTSVVLGDKIEVYLTNEGLWMENESAGEAPLLLSPDIVAFEVLYDGEYSSMVVTPAKVKSVTLVVTASSGEGEETTHRTVRKTVRLRNHL